jgi:hypothetical protein
MYGLSDRMLGKCNRCWQDNKLAIVISLFGLFRCSLAIVMIFLYTGMIEEEAQAHSTGKVLNIMSNSFPSLIF